MLTEDQLKEQIVEQLGAARTRSLALTDAVDEDDLVRQHSPLMSPLVWDLAHVGSQEELWLLRNASGAAPMHPEIDDLYDAFKTPRKDRPALPLLGPDETRRYISEVRSRVTDVIERAPLADPPSALLAQGFVFGMVVQHEQQHDETMLATHQLRAGTPVLQASVPDAPWAPYAAETLVEGGPFVMGTSTDPWALDNERPAHRVDVDPFWIDTVPVSNADFAAFVEQGGYERRGWWTATGWAHVREAGLVAPRFWHRDGTTWLRDRFGRTEVVPPDEPVQHVSWYEADAYARSVGKRLPTEAEWEKAAAWDPVAERSRRHPWGDAPPDSSRANLGQRHLQPARVGSYPDGASAYGVRQLLGDVWEWTATDFHGYPGFAVFPYREYSEAFFGSEYKVLRGGSWAVDPAACRTTFRNWDLPVRRQIFAGFRCARSVPGAAHV